MNNPSDKTPQQHTTVPSIPWSSANKPASQTKPASASSRDEDKKPSKASTLNADITWLYIASGERLRRMGDAFLRLPAWLQVMLVYAFSRVWGFIIFSVVGNQQLLGPWGQHLGYLPFISTWDSSWYGQIAQSGYPSKLPYDSTGAVAQNPWAFYPLFPLLAGSINRITGIGYYPVAATVALLAGFAAAWVIYLLFTTSLNIVGYRDQSHGEKASEAASSTEDPKDVKTSRHNLALWAVAAVAFLPVAPVLQVPYAESLNLVFLVWALLLMMRKQYLLMMPVALLACLSRPVGVPLGATAGLWWFACLITEAKAQQQRRQRGEDQERFESVFLRSLPQLGSALFICFCALIWPIYAWQITGRIDAYTATETAWRQGDLAPVAPWISQGIAYFGYFTILLFPLLIVGYAAFLASPLVKRVLASPIILWCACYGAYLLIFLNPQSSTFRLLLPLFPLMLPIVAISSSRAYRWLLIGSGALLQLVWVGWLWHWKQLPGGGDYPP